jgi:hypothetical protein
VAYHPGLPLRLAMEKLVGTLTSNLRNLTPNPEFQISPESSPETKKKVRGGENLGLVIEGEEKI